jgi:hypothetical protein
MNCCVLVCSATTCTQNYRYDPWTCLLPPPERFACDGLLQLVLVPLAPEAVHRGGQPDSASHLQVRLCSTNGMLDHGWHSGMLGPRHVMRHVERPGPSASSIVQGCWRLVVQVLCAEINHPRAALLYVLALVSLSGLTASYICR